MTHKIRNILLFGLCVIMTSSVMADDKMGDVKQAIKTLELGKVQEAVKEFQAAFEAGNGDGAFYIGRLFEMGLGVDKDMTRATQLYAAAVSKNSALAQNRLGLMHLSGESVLQDYKRAAELICASADQNDQNGAFNCGLLYSEGKGVDKDPKKAVTYWVKAAKANHVAALNYLGQAYLDGTGVDKDPVKAIKYFNKTAQAGNAMGLYEIAKAYKAGYGGMKIDKVKAHAYANLAAARGLREAGLFRDELLLEFDASNLEKAQDFARDWKAVPIEQAQ